MEHRKGFGSIALAIFLLAIVASAHEVVVVPTSTVVAPTDPNDPPISRPSLLPVLIAGDHLSLSAASLSFDTVEVGDSADRSLTLTNVSADTLAVGFELPSESLSIAPSAVTLQPAGSSGDSAAVTLTWAPEIDGSLSGSLSLVESHAGALAVETAVSLSGTATSLVSISPKAIDFGVIDNHDSATEPLTIRNLDSAPVTVSIIASSGGVVQAIPSTRQTLGAAGTPTASLTYSVLFAPGGSATTFDGHLTITATPSVGAPVVHALPVDARSTDLGGAGGVIVDPQSLMWDVVRAGDARVAPVLLANSSAVDPVTVELAITGSNALSVSKQSLQLLPGAQQSVDVTWSPVGNTTLLGTLTASAFYPGSADPIVRSKAFEGFSKTYPTLPAVFDFGEAVAGVGSASVSLTLTVPAGAAAFTFEPELPATVTLVPNNATVGRGDVVFGTIRSDQLTVFPGESVSVELVWSPDSLQPLNQPMTVRHRYADTIWQTFHLPLVETVTLAGTPRRGPELELWIGGSPAGVFDCGKVSRRPYDAIRAPQVDVEIRNVGDAAAAVTVREQGLAPLLGCFPGPTAVCVYGSNGQQSPFAVPAGDSLTVSVSLFAGEVGAMSRTLTFDALGSDPVDFELRAEGVPYLKEFDFGSPPVLAGKGANTDDAANDPLAAYRPTGFDAEGLFDLGEVDAVDVRSGNLVLTVPILSQAARGGLGYSLAATYNSNLWARASKYQVPGDPLPGPPPAPWNAEYPDPANNNGMGWSVHLGRLRAPLDFDGLPTTELERERMIDTGPYWTYIDPSGASHRFSLDLNNPSNPHELGNDLETASPLYARDGSHLRLRLVDGDRWLEFPTGEVHVFRRFSSTLPSHPDPWRLVEMRDRFDNVITVSYTAWTWSIVDDFRTTTLTFVATSSLTPQIFSDHYPVVVRSVTTAGFAGATRSWDFAYVSSGPVARPPGDTYPANDATGVTVPLLDSITLPDGTAWSFSYDPAEAVPGDVFDLRLESASLPTGGSLQWEYERIFDTVVSDCFNGGEWTSPESVGVMRRTALDIGGATLSERRYLRDSRRYPSDLANGSCRHYTSPEPSPADPNWDDLTPAPEMQVGIWTQLEAGLSSLDLQYFSIWPFAPHPDSTMGWDRRERGLNQTRSEQRGERFLASKLYGCAADLPAEFAAVPRLEELVADPACTHQESRYVKYELPRSDTCEADGGTPCHVGARLIEEETVYETDNQRSLSRVLSDYDGLGHYRRTETGGDFARGNSVTREQDWNSGNGTLTLRDDGTGLVDVDVPLPETWILETYTTDTVTEGGVTRGREACFKPGTGWLHGERVWAGDAPGGTDLVTIRKRNTSGELILRSFFGADTSVAVPVGLDLCDDSEWAVQLVRDYAVEYEYQGGVLARQRVVNQSVYEHWRDVDEATGWIGSETLNSGETITFGYDSMGRVASATSDTTARRSFGYTPPAGAQGWKLTAEAFEHGTSLLMQEYQADFDGLGRPVVERFRHPDNTLKEQTRVYHPSGLLASVSTVNNPAEHLTSGYDFKGRILKRTLPDGSAVDYQYTGDRIVREIADVAGVAGTIRSVRRSELDGQGRVFKLDVGELGANSQVDVTYSTELTFDPLGQTTSARRGGQTRTWVRDGRGFLLSEAIPEKKIPNPASPGSYQHTVSHFSGFTTRGQARTVQEKQGNSVLRTTSLGFDSLGRPTSVVVGGQTLKSWTYHGCASAVGAIPDLTGCPGDHGQVDIATRRNAFSSAESGGVLCATGSDTLTVTDSHLYDAAGRLHEKRTRVQCAQGPASADFFQSWTWDDLGQLDASRHPCTGAGCLSNSASSLAVDFVFEQGLLTSVSAGVQLGASFLYHDDGQLSKISRGNGLADLYQADASGMRRVGRIQLGQVGFGLIRLDLGAYSYDGAGNIQQIGDDVFRYDTASRLVEATLPRILEENPNAATATLTYAYDDFDNRTDATVDPVNNHLIGTGPGGSNEHDAFGNLIAATTGAEIVYDGLEKIKGFYDKSRGSGCNDPAKPCTLMVYDASDLRVLSWRTGRAHRWTPRDYQGRVMADFTGNGMGNLTVGKEYVYAGSSLLSTRDFSGERHYHLDHLGSTRLITNATGGVIDQIHTRPYGETIDPPEGDAANERMDYTGHERDDDGLTMYMRARQYLIPLGRFMQIDPARSGWNPYSYSRNNPLKFLDPDGLAPIDLQNLPEVRSRSLDTLSNNNSFEYLIALGLTGVGLVPGIGQGVAIFGAAAAAFVATDEFVENAGAGGIGGLAVQAATGSEYSEGASIASDDAFSLAALNERLQRADDAIWTLGVRINLAEDLLSKIDRFQRGHRDFDPSLQIEEASSQISRQSVEANIRRFSSAREHWLVERARLKKLFQEDLRKVLSSDSE